jgi:hypothetical protein
MPIIFGVVLFLLGYYLDAESVRLLWLVFTGFMVLMGIMMLVMVNVFLRGNERLPLGANKRRALRASSLR